MSQSEEIIFTEAKLIVEYIKYQEIKERNNQYPHTESNFAYKKELKKLEKLLKQVA